MGRKHYHVYFQTVGCMPDDNQVCSTRREAEECARGMAQDCRESGRIVRGSARQGYYEVEPINLIAIEACTESHCTEGNDHE